MSAQLITVLPSRMAMPQPVEWLPGREAERLGMGPAVMLGQDLAEVAGPVGDGASADLAARHRKLGNSHREAAGF